MKIEIYIKIIIRNIIRILNGYGSFRLKKNKNTGKAVHVIVNGPSLNETVHFVDELPGDVIMVNFAPTTDLFFEHKPQILCFADPNFFDNQTEAEEVFGNIEKADYDCKIVFSDFLVNKYHGTSKKIQVYGANTISSSKESDDKLKYWLYKKNYMMPTCMTVAVMALYVAIQFGYETVYLHGNDFTYLHCLNVDKKNNVIFKDEHYYGTIERNLTQEGSNMKSELRALYYCMKGYNEVADYAKNQKVKIYNMCPTSMIDVFEKYCDKYGE